MNISKFSQFFLVALLLAPLANAANKKGSANSNSLIESATFSNNLQLPMPTARGQKSIGLLNQDMNGWGIIFRQALMNEREFWILGSYKPNSHLMTEEFNPSTQVAAVDLNEVSRVQVVTGIDQIFHLTSNKRWGVVGGLGIGISRSEYEAKYYRQLCTSFCGFDPSDPHIQKDLDLSAQLIGRFGVGLRDRQVWGVKGRFNFLIGPTIARLPKEFKFIGPGDKEVTPVEYDQFFIEALIEI